ncbi:chemotaxis-specific protein-glutamate methyltransferase CheB [Egibacter rhizosphaerae]|uniref:Protein-glutamate methylesterase/protein-glutamine glutaminase n=1 Tax=Egibacter rhizosphaerae TaxID=1670831 RepID=A0A411YJ81_9ACTN|nr:chemotaxis-specific protein-glutamate methyltransferase CheB [Egibacter rhizosphaerae]QBI21257.1 chemotaxis-specific protein-glutamate methyltransferase CheB [Egibacter rhizosphaerae]
MARKRVLVVDDSVVVRKLVTEVIAADDGLEVCGTAPNGRIALAKVDQLAPDLVTLDVEMPDMNGLEALSALRESHPELPVVMFSTLTDRGARVTLDALMRGANDYVTKPANVGGVSQAIAAVKAELIPKVRALTGADDVRPAPPTRLSPAARARPAASRSGSGRIDLIVVGVSTGGPNVLAEFVPHLPGDLGVPMVIVQHMPPVFTQLLAQRLDARSPLTVAEGSDGAPVQGGQVWIAPGDRHLLVRRDAGGLRLGINIGPPENSCRPSADVLFRSAVEACDGRVLGLVLTGMGQDGLRGSERIVEAGGSVLAQDKASSVVWGMPGAVTQAGLAEEQLPVTGLVDSVVRRVRAGAGRAAAEAAR